MLFSHVTTTNQQPPNLRPIPSLSHPQTQHNTMDRVRTAPFTITTIRSRCGPYCQSYHCSNGFLSRQRWPHARAVRSDK